MARNQENLLEAFQSANDEREGRDPASAGPFAGDSGSAPRAPRTGNLLPALSHRDARVVLGFTGFGLLCFVIGLVVGRQFDSDPTLAAESARTALQNPAGSDTTWPGSEYEPGEAINDALEDPDTRYTVLAFSCPETDSGKQQANTVYFSLRDQGLPVAFPVAYNKKVYVLVGAAATADELTALEAHLRTRPGPDGRSFDYAEAFVLPIDNLFRR